MASYVKAICDRNPIHTTAQKTPGDNGFKISFEGTPSQDKFRPGDVYTGKLRTHKLCANPFGYKFDFFYKKGVKADLACFSLHPSSGLRGIIDAAGTAGKERKKRRR